MPVVTPLPHRTLIRAIAAAVSAVAAITLVGWAAAIPEIVEPRSVTPMAPATALAVLALACGLWALSAERRRTAVASVAGGVAAIVGVACAVEAIAGSGTGVSEALFGVAAFTPAVTGLVVAALGLAVALDCAGRRVAQRLAAAAGVVAACGLLGYLFGVPLFVGPARAVHMSWQTAACGALIAVAFAAAHPDRGAAALLADRGVGGRFARWSLIAVVGIPVAAGILCTAAARAGWFPYSVAGWLETIVAVLCLAAVAAWGADRLRRDDAARAAYERRLERLAARDPLTGGYNRRHFLAEAERAAARAHRYGEPAAVAVVDLDNFKEINDRWGHAAGDEALVRVYRALRGRLRSSDVLGRIGGDEFAALLTHVDPAAAEGIAREMREAVAMVGRELAEEGRPNRLGASVGVAMLDRTTEHDPGAVLDLADRRMYGQKRFRRRAAADAPAGG